jgi:DNA-directed RNA polymerase I subunit RPA2
MAPMTTSVHWGHEYNTLRREKLFRSPPKDHTAYPALQEAVAPHIESFNAIFGNGALPGLIHHAIADIGTKIYIDGDLANGLPGKNKLAIRYKDVTLSKPQLPPTNKFAVNREIYPAECRERHATYRGRLTTALEYRINGGDWREFVLDLGQAPIMLKVRDNLGR